MFSPEVHQLWAQCQSLQIREGLLCRKYVRPFGFLQFLQLVVPRSLRIAFLDAVYAGSMNGHPGTQRTRHRLQELAYWQGWTSDMRLHVQLLYMQPYNSVLCVRHTGPDTVGNKDICSMH